MTEKFTFFWKNRSPFSQWHMATFEKDGVIFNCTEQYMMYKKAELFGDKNSMRQIIATNDPRAQKSLGRLVDNFNQQEWNEKRYGIVYDGNKLKFRQNPSMYQSLMETKGTTVVEASPYDKIWGIALNKEDPRALDRSTWKGQNLLGEILTSLRDEFLDEDEFLDDVIA